MLYLTSFSSSDYSRSGYDYYGGYDRCGRVGYAADKSYGGSGHRTTSGYQSGINGMFMVRITWVLSGDNAYVVS
jgi:hypothetical protein